MANRSLLDCKQAVFIINRSFVKISYFIYHVLLFSVEGRMLLTGKKVFQSDQLNVKMWKTNETDVEKSALWKSLSLCKHYQRAQCRRKLKTCEKFPW